jgi:hypothetical protein
MGISSEGRQQIVIAPPMPPLAFVHGVGAGE